MPSSVRLMPTSITTAPGLTMSAVTKRGAADGDDQHVGAARHGRQVARARVARSSPSRCACSSEQRDRLARRCSSGRRPRPRAPSSADLVVVEQLDHAGGRARAQARAVEHELADALGMEAVDVLGGVDARERARLVEAVRQRALHEDAVHGGIGVERVDRARRARPAAWSPAARGGTSACRPRPSARSCAARRSASRDRRRRAPWRDRAAARRRRSARARPRRRARGPSGRRPRRRGSVRSWRPRVDDRRGRQAQLAAAAAVRIIRTGDPQIAEWAEYCRHAGPSAAVAQLEPAARCSADARRVAGPSDAFPARERGDPPNGGLIPGAVAADGGNTRGPGAPMCGASRRAPDPSSDYTRGHELQHPQPGHRRRARDRRDRRGAHLHEQRAAGRKGRASAREGDGGPCRRSCGHSRQGHPCARRSHSAGRRPGRPAARRADHAPTASAAPC